MEPWMFWTGLAVLTILNIGSLVFNSFVKGYAAKQAQDVATHQDIEGLVEQVRAVTQSTKEIEARISNDAWARQRNWELKKEVIFDLLEMVTALRAAVVTVMAADPKKSENGDSKGEQLANAMSSLGHVQLKLHLLSDGELLSSRIQDVSAAALEILRVANAGLWNQEQHQPLFATLNRSIATLTMALRAELAPPWTDNTV